MICPTCRGRGFVPIGALDEELTVMGPCPDCIGGIASCCDAAGSPLVEPSFTCPRCGAVSYNPNDIRERYCGRCHVFACDAPKVGVPTPVFVCAACGAIQRERIVRCEQCGEPLVFPKFADDPYRDDTCPERLCDLCGHLYRGPAVYCSLKCALDDAA